MPFTASEWGRFAFWLKEKNMQPADLLTREIKDLLQGWEDQKCTVERIRKLLERGTALALAVEKWQRIGIWVLVRSDVEYPVRLKERLKGLSPPVLFGCGRQKLLNTGGIAIVGSRNASDEDLEFAKSLGEQLAKNGRTVISGGARGIDQAAMFGAIEAEGTVVGVLADGLSKAVISQKYRSAIQNRNLVLISPFYPDTGFNVGNAMGRNKYIYCLSDGAVAVHSGKAGGTWSGAVENLRKNWVPIWVKRTTDKYAGNSEIVNKGANWLPEDILSNFDKFFSQIELTREMVSKDKIPLSKESNVTYQTTREDSLVSEGQLEAKHDVDKLLEKSLYQIFCLKLELILASRPSEPKYLEEQLALTSGQLKIWLKHAINDGLIVKKNKPLRYELSKVTRREQLSLFSGQEKA